MIECLRTPANAASWLQARVEARLQTDSRLVASGDGFIAWPGAATDGRLYVAQALASGAKACLVEESGLATFGLNDERIAAYPGLKAATGPIAAAYFNAPSELLDVVAVTGTNGKTSTTWMLAQALTSLGRRCGVVGTLGVGEPGAMAAGGLTTPDPVLLQAQFRRWVDEGFSACAIEASSIGLVERRLDATTIRVAVFTNFTQDHLDFHASMQTYWEAKRSLFDWPGLHAAVLNIDDPKGAELAGALKESNLDVWTCSVGGAARLTATQLRYQHGGLSFEVAEGTERHLLATRLIGDFNAANLLGALGALRALGVPLADAVGACAALLPVPGRMDLLDLPNAPLVVIDYAHTPDALEKALQALQPLAQSRSGELWCVFGCGGNRDAGKRPLMAAVAEQHAAQIVLTSDNPRREDPMRVIDDVAAGFSGPDVAHIEPDRAEAIAYSVRCARAQDVVLLAGKGHENYQEVQGRKIAFSDRDHALAALAATPLSTGASRSAA